MLQDAIVIGGSFAGLSAAMMLARARRAVLVIDAGAPRNRFAERSHGVLAQDGRPGGAILADARRQLAAYPTATLAQGRVVAISGADGAFVVETEDGAAARGRKVLLATGIVDELPELPGLAERWGSSVLHCPYCHGYEVGGGAIGVLGTMPASVHHAALLADWGTITFFPNGIVDLDEEARALLARRNVRIEERLVAGVEGPGRELEAVLLEDGSSVKARALFVATRARMASPLADALGCAFDETPIGPLLHTDAQKQTSVPGVYAAGDAAHFPSNVMLAAADGVLAGVGLHQALVAAG
ncbi:NAD(P)/FAD-dependent oxidoreductase [Vulgatibacter sp.]|uniref:NAD(P)/FAD-dependent oxidoreductase n=1 Tax=Vulgatibacter sp. TaxID=1971226 RepID=UPI003565BDC2